MKDRDHEEGPRHVRKPGMESPQMVRSADGTPIALWRSGSGPPIIAVHGGAGDHTSFAAVAALLEGDFTVYAMDRRGRGASGDGPSYGLEREVEDVLAALEAVGDPAYLYGHSFGGGSAWLAARRFPRLAGLALYEGGLRSESSPSYSEAFIEELERLVRNGRGEDALVKFLRAPGIVTDTEIAAMKQSPRWPTRVAIAPTIARELRATNGHVVTAAECAAMPTRVLLLAGSETLPARRDPFLSFAEFLPDVRVFDLPGQGHAANQTAPALVADALRSGFLGGGSLGEGQRSAQTT